MRRSSSSDVTFWFAALIAASLAIFGSVQLGKGIGEHILSAMLAQQHASVTQSITVSPAARSKTASHSTAQVH